MSCVICQSRKEKRFCPAVHGRICPICCGREREVTLDCPSECVYLQQARLHERPRSPEELRNSIEAEALFPQIDVGQQFVYDREPLIVGLSFAIARIARGDRSLRDRDVIAALTAVTKTYETLVGSGLHYQAPVASPVQQALGAELQKMIAEYREAEQKHLGYYTLKDGEVLKALVFILRMVYARTNGRPKSRAFLDFVLAQFPEKPAVASPAESASRIVLP